MSLLGSALKLTTAGVGAVARRLPRLAMPAAAVGVAYDTFLPQIEATTGWELPGDGGTLVRAAERIGEQVGGAAAAASAGAGQGAAGAYLGALGFDATNPQTRSLITLGMLGLGGLFVMQAVRR